MSTEIPSIPVLVWQTLRAPRRTAERILGLRLPPNVLWEALFLGVVITVIAVVGLMLAAPADPTDPATMALQEMYAQPIPVAIGQTLSAVITVFAITWIGRFFGGTGTLEGALALVAWHQIFLLSVALAGILAGLIFPPILSLLLIAMIVLYFYVLTQFICALHGFANPVAVFGMILVSFFALLLAVSVLTGILAAIFLGGTPHV
ncbi:Yip1 family protein [Tropicimonas sp. IMCC6043]|uniref:Yip1 family protein n=1 Tax=Tropicimonas sp. IMCC6043 TaxID=2510645 RepID=UPI00101CE66F|nr:Yip1 family protein [Tropicimonas sp. IMCC6043]RYH10517.1 YIP1 family protein [Tropicimonas sp. IMCC6043]